MLGDHGALATSAREFAPGVAVADAPDDALREGAYVLELAAWPAAAPTFPDPRPGAPRPGFFRLVDTRASG